MSAFLAVSYIISSIFFILSIRGLASPKTARKGNILGVLGMFIAIVSTIISNNISEYYWMTGAIVLGGIVGVFSALKVKMTSLPQMIAAFNGLGGLSAVLISLAEIISDSQHFWENSVGLIIGALAFSGSFIAFAKLQGLISSKSITFYFQPVLNAILGIATICLCVLFVVGHNILYFYLLAALSIVVGFLLILPIGGADMPVVISILN